MRYTPAAVALSLLVAVSSSAILSAPAESLDPRAVKLMSAGKAAAAAGELQQAIDAYEAALAVEPGNVTVLIALADTTRRTGMRGKALDYYRAALKTDPRNLSAIAGEGMALAEKGATEKASRNLARLHTLCGKNCDEARDLASAIAKGESQRVMTAEAATPKVASEN